MFLGEFSCLFVWLIKTGCKGQVELSEEEDTEEVPLSPGQSVAKEKKLKTKINPFYLAIPASCDFCGSTTMFIALTQCAASVYQMMRGAIVIIAALMSVAFLGAKQYCHHWTSLIVIMAGVAIVGLVSVLESGPSDDSGDETPTSLFGVILLIVAQCFTGLQFISEEKILSGYYLDPLLVVGLEGMFGTLYYCILLPIFQQINCDGALCHGGKLEDSALALKQFGEHPELIAQSIGIIFSIAFFNVSGVTITKYASAAQRSTVDTCRTLIIWLVSMAIGWEKFLAWELVGFFMLVGGTLVYNEIYIMPCQLFNQNTKVNIAKREGKLDSMVDTDKNYMASSPHAAYDQNRMKRNLDAKVDDRQRLMDKHNEGGDGNMYINDYSTK
jgi:drug/metabolite transporter (DMT)-like permease